MRVSARTDAKNQRTTYAYDDYGRLTQVGYRTLVNGQWVENTGQRVQHFYDTNPVDSTWSAYGWGRRTASYFGTDSRFKYLYRYNQAGRLTGMRSLLRYGPLRYSNLAHPSVVFCLSLGSSRHRRPTGGVRRPQTTCFCVSS